ncbi:MAG: 50S ribosomal protein L15 [Mycoplasmataceae bacterium]|nr:50S ribosomal protein L15 [Mycoplasmataceae bacterium]
MKLNELKYTEGSRKDKKRVGRGIGSKTGKTAGRGENGQKSRSGGSVRIGFEGGQTPIYRRLPKRGFTPYNQKNVAEITIDRLNKIDNNVIDANYLVEKRILKGKFDELKVIGNSKANKAFTITADKFSAGAKKSIEEAGGKAILSSSKSVESK